MSTPTDQIDKLLVSPPKEKSWGFSPNDKQAFVVKLRTQDRQSWEMNTAIIFENTERTKAERWEYAAGLSRLYDPHAIMAVFYTQWETFKTKFADALTLSQYIQKLSSFESLIRSDVPYTVGDESKKCYEAFPLRFYDLKIFKKTNEIEFFVGFLAGGITENPSIRISIPMMQKSLIEAQYRVRDRLDIIGGADKLPPYMNVANYLKESKKNLPLTFDAFNLSAVFKRKDKIPEFYKQIWSFIADDVHLPDVVRLYVLLSFYDKILTHYLSADDKSNLEEGVFAQARGALSGHLDYHYSLVPDKACAELAKAVTPKSYKDHAMKHSQSASGSVDVMKNAAGNALAYVSHKKFIRDYVEELYLKLLKEQELTIPLMVLVKALYYVLSVTPGDDTVEESYLSKYIESLDFALQATEIEIDKHFFDMKYEQASHPGTQKCEITAEACESIIALQHSPFAWEQIFNQYKLPIALKNFSLGYLIPAEKGFKIIHVSRAQDKSDYTITYALGKKKTEAFHIRSTPALESFLHQETKKSFSMPLSRRVETAHLQLQEFLKEKQEVVQRLFSDKYLSLWTSEPRIHAVYLGLKTHREEVKFTLTVNEKINLMVYSLIGIAMEDINLIGPVAEIFRLITNEKEGCFVISTESFLAILTRFNSPVRPLQEICRRKAILCETLVEIDALKHVPERFKTYDEIEDIFREADQDDYHFSKDREVQARIEQTKFIKGHLKDELKKYPTGDLVAVYAIYFYLNTWQSPPENTLDLLQKIANGLLVKSSASQYKIWATGIFFQSLSQCHLYQLEHNEHQALALVTLADHLLADVATEVTRQLNQGTFYNSSILEAEKKSLALLLEQLESASLEKDIVPQFLNGAPPVVIPEPQPVVHSLPKKVPKGKRVVKTPIITQDQETQTDFITEPQQPPPNMLATGLQAAAGAVNAIYTGVTNTAAAVITKLPDAIVPSNTNVVPVVPLPQDLPADLPGVPDMLKTKIQEQITPQYESENESYYSNLKEKYRQPEVYTTYNKVTSDYYAVSTRLTGLFKKYGLSQDALKARLAPYDGLARAALNEKSNIVGALAIPFDSLEDYHRRVVEAGHQEQLEMKAEVKELDKQIKSISKLTLEKNLNDLKMATTQLNANCDVVEKKLKEAKAKAQQNKQQSEKASQDYLMSHAVEMIASLDQLEKQVSAECSVMHPTTCAKIYAYGQYQCTVDNGIRALTHKPKNYAELLQASSQLRLTLGVLSKQKLVISGLQDQYQALKSDLSGMQSQVDKLSWLSSPLKKISLMYSMSQLKDKIASFEKVQPSTGIVAAYEKLHIYNPFHWPEMYRLSKKMNDTTALLSTESKSKQIEMITDNSLLSEFEALQIAVPTNQRKQTDDSRQLIWVAQKMQEKGWREHVETLFDKDDSELIDDCDTALNTFNNALTVCRQCATDKIDEFVKAYDKTKEWSNPSAEVEAKTCDDLFANVPVPSQSQSQSVANKSTFQYGSSSSSSSQLHDFRSAVYNDSDTIPLPGNARYSATHK